MKSYDAVVVGSGPNGLAAAITLARARRSVLIVEAAGQVGGGLSSEQLTLPGFVHDVCSAVHPMAVASPFFKALPLEEHGLEWIEPPSPLAHPLEDETAVLLEHSIEATADQLGEDRGAYLRLMRPLVARSTDLFEEIFQPMAHVPKHPLLLARFGMKAILPAETYAKLMFRGKRARALFAGIAAHVNTSLSEPGTAAIGIMLNIAGHADGWPIPKGGSQKVADALASLLRSLGGEIEVGRRIRSIEDLPRAKAVLFDLTPKQIVSILGPKLSESARRRMLRFRYGPGVFKMDWALSAPIPWKDERCARAATVHLGENLEEIARSESLPGAGRVADRPYVLLSQPTLFDSTRVPAKGGHIAWAYSHVPSGSDVDISTAIENQIERYAPGFRSSIIGRSVLRPKQLQERNANLIGGDLSGGVVTLKQLLFRPYFSLDPYRLPVPGYYICSSSTPPGPSVHGMCGYNAARSALRAL